MAEKKLKRYTPEDDAAIRACRSYDEYRDLAKRLGRTFQGIVARASDIGHKLTNEKDWPAIAQQVAELHSQGWSYNRIRKHLKISEHSLRQLATGRYPAGAGKPIRSKQPIHDAIQRWERARGRDDRREFNEADRELSKMLRDNGPEHHGRYIYLYSRGDDAVIRAKAARAKVAS